MPPASSVFVAEQAVGKFETGVFSLPREQFSCDSKREPVTSSIVATVQTSGGVKQNRRGEIHHSESRQRSS